MQTDRGGYQHELVGAGREDHALHIAGGLRDRRLLENRGDFAQKVGFSHQCFIDRRSLILLMRPMLVYQLRWFLHRFDWGVAAREKTVRVLKLLEKGPHLKEERERARKISHGIQGFGSFNLSWSSTTVHRPELVDSRIHDTIINSEKENSKRDAGIDPQIRRAAGTARRRPLQETSGYNNSATEGTASPATTKMHLPEESKPLLHY
ncbi:hypothetical protein B296_00039149 [Ensete ventricosum]|uniref:Uncharacterized protein n=1 Tax=Ensete ventricosum TaxID=4639 RepID=A0A426ZJ26_ENSVE|nr:hypothetical protein B296_00039149 [Ensete ventricosum]